MPLIILSITEGEEESPSLISATVQQTPPLGPAHLYPPHPGTALPSGKVKGLFSCSHYPSASSHWPRCQGLRAGDTAAWQTRAVLHTKAFQASSPTTPTSLASSTVLTRQGSGSALSNIAAGIGYGQSFCSGDIGASSPTCSSWKGTMKSSSLPHACSLMEDKC